MIWSIVLQDSASTFLKSQGEIKIVLWFGKCFLQTFDIATTGLSTLIRFNFNFGNLFVIVVTTPGHGDDIIRPFDVLRIL